jgi:hypothetical protein
MPMSKKVVTKPPSLALPRPHLVGSTLLLPCNASPLTHQWDVARVCPGYFYSYFCSFHLFLLCFFSLFLLPI